MEIPIQYELEEKDYLELWKFFAERGDYYKDKMWSIAIWMFALITGVLGYIANNFLGKVLDENGKEIGDVWFVSEPLLCSVFSFFAILFCMYAVATFKDYADHVRRNWDRANYVLLRVKSMPEAWMAGLNISERKADVQKLVAKEEERSVPGKIPPPPKTQIKKLKKFLKEVKKLNSIPKRLVYLTFGFILVFGLLILLSIIEFILLLALKQPAL